VVLATKLADSCREGVQFAVAAHVQSYRVNFVCSIWIYIATLQKKK
jgi:hypothetical protein